MHDDRDLSDDPSAREEDVEQMFRPDHEAILEDLEEEEAVRRKLHELEELAKELDQARARRGDRRPESQS